MPALSSGLRIWCTSAAKTRYNLLVSKLKV